MNIGYLALRNRGNDCYLNSALQFITQGRDVNKNLMKYFKESELYCFFLLMFKQKWDDKESQDNPKNIKYLVSKKFKQFDNNHQQDSHEFLVCLLDLLENKTIKKFYDSTIESTVKCNNCNHISKTKQSQRYISLSIPNQEITLRECLKKFILQEDITDWRCEKCKQNSGTKKNLILNLPKYLIIHFKRFRWLNNGRRINTPINFPINWKINNNNKYKLISIINHYGSFNGGHYTSAGRVNSKQWRLYDDSRVSSLNPTNITNNFNTSAYLLLYEKI
jgi:ubiquitin carboxyl-terminal hydrolase 8